MGLGQARSIIAKPKALSVGSSCIGLFCKTDYMVPGLVYGGKRMEKPGDWISMGFYSNSCLVICFICKIIFLNFLGSRLINEERR